mgnify:CR=1 FL=1
MKRLGLVVLMALVLYPRVSWAVGVLTPAAGDATLLVTKVANAIDVTDGTNNPMIETGSAACSEPALRVA